MQFQTQWRGRSVFRIAVTLMIVGLGLVACGGGGGGNGDGRIPPVTPGPPGTPPNTRPVAVIDSATSVTTGTSVALDGRASSDADGDGLTYQWRLLTQPSFSDATVSNANSAQASFTPDYDGTYTVSLSVDDGTRRSIRVETIIVSSSPANVAPTIAGFAADVVIANIGDTVTFGWTARDVNSDTLTCTLDVTGGGDPLLVINDCASVPGSAYLFATGGDFVPRLSVDDGNGGSATADIERLSIYGPVIIVVGEPQSGDIVGDALDVVVRLIADFEVDTVRAQVADREIALTFANDAFCDRRDDCFPGFAGTLSLQGLTSGEYVASITARDVNGTQAVAYRRVVLNRGPTLQVSQPANFGLARPTTTVEASCSDSEGDCTLRVTLDGDELASAVGQLTQTLNLSAAEGQRVVLTITATDGLGQVNTMTRTLYVESSARLLTESVFAGPVIAIDALRALILLPGPNGDGLAIQDRASRNEVAVPVPASASVNANEGFLTPTGAIYATQGSGGRLYDWRNGTLVDLGRPNGSTSLSVSGDYAIWSDATTLYLRQFSSGVNTLVATDAGNTSNDVASNGVVAYWSSTPTYQVRTWSAGATTVLADDGGALWNTYPLTNGSAVIYRKSTPCCNNQSYQIALHDGAAETILTAPRASRPDQGRDYQVAGGWAAWNDTGNLAQLHVWTRSPDGILGQRTFFGSSSYIDRLGADGSAILINQEVRYLSPPTTALEVIGSDLGRSLRIGSTWYVVIGNSLLRVQ